MFPSIVESSRFLFVPGPQDPGPGNILPRPPISQFITEEIRNKIPFCEFLSNPCRLVFDRKNDHDVFLTRKYQDLSFEILMKTALVPIFKTKKYLHEFLGILQFKITILLTRVHHFP